MPVTKPAGGGTALWWFYPFANDYGGKEPFGNFPKPDLNIQVPDGFPVVAILPGTVSGINSPTGGIPSYGAVITIRLDTPVNAIATHTAYLHLASVASNMRVGVHVEQGDLVGYNGGALAAGTQKVPLGFALYNGDYYGYGPTWAEYLGSPQLNPYNLVKTAAGGKPIGSSATLLTGANRVIDALSPNANVSATLHSIDQFMTIKNPFDTSNQGGGGDSIPVITGISGATWPDPLKWLGVVGTNLFEDTQAIAVRLAMMVLALFILYKVFSHFVDVGKITSTALKAGGTLAML